MKVSRLTYYLFFALTSGSGFSQNQNTAASDLDDIHTRIKQEADSSLKVRTIGILVYDGFFELDAIGPQAVLSSTMGVQVFFVAPKKGQVKGSANTLQVDKGIEEVSHLDILLIPGGLRSTYLMTKDTTVLNWIRKIDSTSTFTVSVCTGSWVLGAAGLLKGKKATSNWYRAEEMLKEYGANFENRRWVKDGKYWTAAGVSAGIDMSLAMMMVIKGKTYTELSMLHLEYDPQPPFPAGSVEKTDPGLVKMLNEMYDTSLKGLR